MFQTEILSNGGRRILVLVNALMQMPPRVTNITCITQVTFKLINMGLLVNNGRSDLARFQMLTNTGWTCDASYNLVGVCCCFRGRSLNLKTNLYVNFISVHIPTFTYTALHFTH